MEDRIISEEEKEKVVNYLQELLKNKNWSEDKKLDIISMSGNQESEKDFEDFFDRFRGILPCWSEIKTKAGITGIEIKQIDNTQFFEKDNRGQIRRFVPKKLGDFIKERCSFKTIRGNDAQVYFYQDGYYKENGLAIIKEIARKLLGNLANTHYVNEVVNHIKDTTYIDAEAIEHPYINLRNGLFNPLTKEIKPHDPEVFCLQQLPIDYDPEAKCDLWIKTLKEKCPDSNNYDTAQEYFGYCFLKDQRFEKAVLLYGQKRTFKSTLLSILGDLLGENSVIAVSLQQLAEDRFIPACLFGKLANICADISSRELKNTGAFMKFTGQDRVTYGKKQQNPITFQPITKLLFSANVIPATQNQDSAFYRRWILLNFSVQTPENQIDPDMRKKLQAELSGILNWAVEGLDRLLKNNKFSYALTDLQVQDLYERNSNSVQSFIFNEIDCEDDEAKEKKREIYEAYKQFCKNNNLKLENPIKFGRDFFGLTNCGNCKINVIPGYAGIRLKSSKGEKQEKF